MSSSLPPFLATDPDVYEHFMGRWSARLAEPFLDVAGVQSGDRVAVLDESIRTLRAQIKARPIVWANGQADLWRRVGLVEVVEMPIVLSFDYTGFEDYWPSFSTGPTRIA
jgi:hypothetical protein